MIAGVTAVSVVAIVVVWRLNPDELQVGPGFYLKSVRRRPLE
jgi:hypothetical protein